MVKNKTFDSLNRDFVELTLSEIIPYPKNNRKHSKKDIDEIIKSIQKDGYIAPIIVDEANVVIAGHGRLLALQKLKIKQIKILKVFGMSEEQKRDYRIRDNTTSLLAEFDLENLRIELKGLGDFSIDLLDHLSDINLDLNFLGLDEEKTYNEAIEDEVPEIPEKEIVVKKGDVFKLGEHYLFCGDATNEDDILGLLYSASYEEQKDIAFLDIVLTDPPYLMNYQGSGIGKIESNGKQRKASEAKKIINDDLKGEEGQKFLQDFLEIIKKYCKGSWYIFFYRLGLQNLYKALEAQKMQVRNTIIWKKEHHTLSNSDYKSIYEPLVNGWADDYQPIFYGWNEEHKFYGKKGEVDFYDLPVSSILENQRSKKNDLHPTMKPISLLEKILNNSTLPKHKVLDLFGGSGSTLIACEKKDRQCYMIELDPKFVQVIIKRFYDVTGGTKEIKCLNRDFDFSFLSN